MKQLPEERLEGLKFEETLLSAPIKKGKDFEVFDHN